MISQIFTPNHKITVVSDVNHTMILFAEYGSWLYNTVLFQCNNADSTNYNKEQKINDCKIIAYTIQQSDFLCILISKLISSGFKFYVDLDPKTDWVKIGIRFGNSISWFTNMGENSFHFDHTYSQVNGKSNKGFKHGESRREAIQKKIGIKIHMLTKN